MRILYFNDAWAIWGGLERVLIEKMNYLADDGYEIYTITYNQGTHPFPYPFNPKVVYRDLNVVLHHQYKYHGLKRYYYKYQLEKLLRHKIKSSVQEIKPDVVICPRIDLVGYLLNIKGNIPLIYESHSSCKWITFEYDRPMWRIKRFLFKQRIKKVQMVVALTEGDAIEWRKITKRVSVIPNVVNLNKTGKYSDCLSKSVIFVGRITEQKDINSLLCIWSIVQQRYPEWHLHIFGEFMNKEEKKDMNIKIAQQNICMHEPTSQIIDRYLNSSILLMTSVYEPFGLVLPEAMSCGLPVVAFDCPYGPADIITDGQDGFLIKNRNINAFAEKVCLLIEDHELRKTMGQAGVLSAQRYDASRVMPMWKELFEHLALQV